MNKLRLIITYDCKKSCKGCCNKSLPRQPEDVNMDYLFNYLGDEVYITGGEPLLYPKELIKFAQIMWMLDKRLFIYSAECSNITDWVKLIPYLAGITFTIHTASDLKGFNALDNWLIFHPNIRKKLSLRLNIFKESGYEIPSKSVWAVKYVEWIKDCPIPDGEDFGYFNVPEYFKDYK